MATLTNIPPRAFQTTPATHMAPFAVCRMPAAMAAWCAETGIDEEYPGRLFVRMKKSGALFLIDGQAWFGGGRWDDVVIRRFEG